MKITELSNFSKNSDGEGKCRLLEKLSLLQIDDSNWIDDDLWKNTMMLSLLFHQYLGQIL
jgi:hypothetical protein